MLARKRKETYSSSENTQVYNVDGLQNKPERRESSGQLCIRIYGQNKCDLLQLPRIGRDYVYRRS